MRSFLNAVPDLEEGTVPVLISFSHTKDKMLSLNVPKKFFVSFLPTTGHTFFDGRIPTQLIACTDGVVLVIPVVHEEQSCPFLLPVPSSELRAHEGGKELDVFISQEEGDTVETVLAWLEREFAQANKMILKKG